MFGTIDDGKRLVTQALRDDEEAMSIITEEPISVQGLYDGSHPTVRAHIDLMVRVRKEDLREKLVQFAHVPLGA
jgi:hypothetical protein